MLRSLGVGVCVLGLLAVLPVACTDGQDESRVGLVKERPTDGRFVETDQGFMVPYEQQVPGTNITFEMVPIPGGRFLLGSPDDEAGRHESEGQQVSVMMDPFWMGKYEVTWKEYRTYMSLVRSFKEFEHRKIRPITEDHELDVITAPSELYDESFSFGDGDGPDSPACTMTQYAAKQYTKWLALLLDDFYRLPSEAEWEYACRAGTTTAYSFGDDLTKLADYAWFEENSGEKRQDVGRKLPNPWGLYDMHGNAAEWVLDAYTEDGYIAIGDGMVPPADAIQWPAEVYPRVARGGSWELDAADLRSAARLASNEDWSMEDPDLPQSPWWHTSSPATGVGFRIMRPLSAPASAEERERYWGAENDEIQESLDDRYENSGRGGRGYVDPELPSAILLLNDDER